MLGATHLHVHFTCAQLALRSHCSGITVAPLLSYGVVIKRAICKDLQPLTMMPWGCYCVCKDLTLWLHCDSYDCWHKCNHMSGSDKESSKEQCNWITAGSYKKLLMLRWWLQCRGFFVLLRMSDADQLSAAMQFIVMCTYVKLIFLNVKFSIRYIFIRTCDLITISQ